MEENPYIVIGWPAIARLNPWNYSVQTVRKKFSKEMKDLGIVVVRWVRYVSDRGNHCRKRQASGSRYLIEQYYLAKAQQDTEKPPP